MAQNNQPAEQDLNQLLKVRHDKLKDLQDNGKDPFQITKYDVKILKTSPLMPKISPTSYFLKSL